MAKQKLKGIKSAYLQHDILKIVFIGKDQEEIPVSIPTIGYLNRRDNEKKRIISDNDYNNDYIESVIEQTWLLARNICNMSQGDLYCIFGELSKSKIFEKYTAKDAMTLVARHMDKNGGWAKHYEKITK